MTVRISIGSDGWDTGYRRDLIGVRGSGVWMTGAN